MAESNGWTERSPLAAAELSVLPREKTARRSMSARERRPMLPTWERQQMFKKIVGSKCHLWVKQLSEVRSPTPLNLSSTLAGESESVGGDEKKLEAG